MLSRLTGVSLILLLFASGGWAEDDASTTAGTFTERGRGFGRALDAVLGRPSDAEGRSLLIVIDPTPSLRTAGFGGDLRAAIARHRADVAGLSIGLRVLGADEHDRKATREHGEILDAVDAALLAGTQVFRNVYEGVRAAASDLSGDGPREILLVTLSNGDGEENIAATVNALERRRIRLSIVTAASFLSDTYWQRYAIPAGVPRGVTMRGGEAAFTEVPWGWVFQTVANEQVSSGFAPFGLSALAHGAKGRIFLHYPKDSVAHACTSWGTCVFCSGDHVTTLTAYRGHKLRVLAPVVASRRAAFAAAARDPFFRATLEAWEAAGKAGITSSRPSVRASGGTLKAERARRRTGASFSGFSLSSHASKARKLAKECEAIAERLHRAIEKAEGGSRRYRAIAELTFVNLHVTRVNLLHLEAWCGEVGPTLFGGRSYSPLAPEVPWYSDDARYVGIGYTVHSLCHGVKPFLRLRLPGGDRLRGELERLDAIVAPFLDRHANTPFAVAVTRSGLARFYPALRGKPSKYVRPPSNVDDDSTTTARPSRGDSTGGGSDGGTTSGGG